MTEDAPIPVARLLRWSVHGTFALLLGIGLAQELRAGRWLLLAVGLALGGLYFAGARRPRPGPQTFAEPHPRLRLGGEPRGKRPQAMWLAVVALAWSGLALASVKFVYLAFPLFFVCLFVLPWRAAVVAVGALTAVAVVTSAGHTHELTVGQVVGPIVGAAVAVLMVLAYRALHRESEQRRLLIEDLMQTRARLVRTEREKASLAERERLGREIHDTLAQGMSSIILLVRAASRDLDADRPGAERHLKEALSAAQENLEEARGFVKSLTPPVLRHSSLAEALQQLTESTADRTGIAIEFAVDGVPSQLPPQYEQALLRIAQGALGNVAAHSAATHARVTLSHLGDAVALDVYDNGKGFDLEAAPRGTGYGLRAMRERTGELGGTLTVESTPGEGTAVVATLPLEVRP